MIKNKKTIITSLVAAATLLFSFPMAVFAQSSSNSYKIEEYYFGTGGEVDASSTNYRSRQSTGGLGVGNASSDNFDVNAGFNTQSEEFLEFVVENTSVNFGTLDSGTVSYGAAQAGGCNCSFYVKTYLSSSYSVVTISQPPTSENGDVFTAMTGGAPVTPDNIEEFGMNLVANTNPAAFGANRVNQPDDSFADGQAAPGYDTTDSYKYSPGDEIARSQATPGNPAIGLTEYTISYVMKPSINTPASFYQMDQILVAIPTF
ncbi:MAG: hypothetical protein ACR2FM_05235 [Candidatus Saccharimonadales bacterium]